MWSLPIPIPENPLRYVNCYALETAAGLVLVDPGWPVRASWDALVAGLDGIGAAPPDVAGVLVSHGHADHHGLAVRLREASGCWVGMHPADAALLASMRDGTALHERNVTWPELCGVPPEERPALEFSADWAERVGRLEPDVAVEGGDLTRLVGRELAARWTPGHTPGHLCFLLPSERLLLTGDHLLPRITSNVGTYTLGTDHLGDYLTSLAGLAAWADALDPEVLPGHEYRFRGVAGRAQQLAGHHAERLAAVVDAVDRLGEPTAWSVARELTWSRGWDETHGARRRLAVAETLAHLVHAEATGALAQVPGTPVRWRTARPEGDLP